MELNRWIWIPVVLMGLVWAMVFVFAFFGFAEAFTGAPEGWWAEHGTAFWLLLGGGVLCMPAFHGVVWLAEGADRFVRGRIGGRGVRYIGGLVVWGLWLCLLVSLVGRFVVPQPDLGIPMALLTFAPLELVLWAITCGLASLTVLAIVDQMRGRHPERSALVVILHLACYVWFYAVVEGWHTEPVGDAWLLIVLAALGAPPMAWLMGHHKHDDPEQETASP